MSKLALKGICAAVGILLTAGVAKADPDYFCYMITSGNQVINLNSLCGSRTTERAALPELSSLPTPIAEAGLEQAPGVLERNSEEVAINLQKSWVEVIQPRIEGNQVSGVIRNRGRKDAFNINVTYEVHNNQNKLIDSGQATYGSGLSPNGRENFSFRTRNGGGDVQDSGVVSFRITWQEYSD